MKKNVFIVLALSFAFVLSSCKKDKNVNYKPEPSPFSAQLENSAAVSASGGAINIMIQAGTDGWWLEIPPDISWITSAKMYGSGDFKLPVTVKANASGSERNGNIILHPTFGLDPVAITISQSK